MTNIIPPPTFDPRKHYAWFQDSAGGEETCGLQIYSAVSVHHLHTDPIPTIDVAIWLGEGFALHRDYLRQSDGKSSATFVSLWNGSGTGIPYGSQYYPFAAVPGKAGEFEGISRLEGVHTEHLHLKFSEAGDEVTLTNTWSSKPDTPYISCFRLEGTKKPAVTG